MSLELCVCVCVCVCVSLGSRRVRADVIGSVCVCVCVCVVGDGQHKEPRQLRRVLSGRDKAAGRRLSFFEKSRD